MAAYPTTTATVAWGEAIEMLSAGYDDGGGGEDFTGTTARYTLGSEQAGVPRLYAFDAVVTPGAGTYAIASATLLPTVADWLASGIPRYKNRRYVIELRATEPTGDERVIGRTILTVQPSLT